MGSKSNGATPFYPSRQASAPGVGDAHWDTFSLKFSAQQAAYYHGMRFSFNDLFGKFISVFSFVAGGASLTTLLQNSNSLLAVWFVIATTTLTGLNLVIGFSSKAKDHFLHRSDFYKFLSELDDLSSDDFAGLRKLRSKFVSMNCSRPPTLSALDAIAYNRTVRALGVKSEFLMRVGIRHRIFAHFWPFTGHFATRVSDYYRDSV